MFENINPLDKTTAWIEIFLLMLGAFLIGYFFARYFYVKKFEKRNDEQEREIQKYKTLSLDNKGSGMDSGIRAVKTRGRGGELPTSAEPEERTEFESIPIIDFEGFSKASEDDRDDLKLINGIGPFIEKKLNSIGIYNLEQISKLTAKDIEDITESINFFPGRIVRDKWVDQAKELIK